MAPNILNIGKQIELVFGYTPRQLYLAKCFHPTFSNQIVRCVTEASLEVFERRKTACIFATEFLQLLFVRFLWIYLQRNPKHIWILIFFKQERLYVFGKKKFPNRQAKTNEKNFEVRSAWECTSVPRFKVTETFDNCLTVHQWNK